jgi:hypothetical protein
MQLGFMIFVVAAQRLGAHLHQTALTANLRVQAPAARTVP